MELSCAARRLSCKVVAQIESQVVQVAPQVCRNQFRPTFAAKIDSSRDATRTRTRTRTITARRARDAKTETTHFRLTPKVAAQMRPPTCASAAASSPRQQATTTTTCDCLLAATQTNATRLKRRRQLDEQSRSGSANRASERNRNRITKSRSAPQAPQSDHDEAKWQLANTCRNDTAILCQRRDTSTAPEVVQDNDEYDAPRVTRRMQIQDVGERASLSGAPLELRLAPECDVNGDCDGEAANSCRVEEGEAIRRRRQIAAMSSQEAHRDSSRRAGDDKLDDFWRRRRRAPKQGAKAAAAAKLEVGSALEMKSKLTRTGKRAKHLLIGYTIITLAIWLALCNCGLREQAKRFLNARAKSSQQTCDKFYTFNCRPKPIEAEAAATFVLLASAAQGKCLFLGRFVCLFVYLSLAS